MASQILADGSGAADSADVTVSAGSVLTVALKNAGNNASVAVFIKDDADQYQPIGSINQTRNPIAITAPGTYRFTRTAGTCGVFSA